MFNTFGQREIFRAPEDRYEEIYATVATPLTSYKE